MMRARRLACAAIAVPLWGCGSDEAVVTDGLERPDGAGLVRYTEEREPCADRNALRNAYFGDLHVHTSYSFDAYSWETRADPAAAYRFARGEPVRIPPLDENGDPTQEVRLERPLDFVAVTDHAEFLGEVLACTDPSSGAYETDFCTRYREPLPDDNSFILMGAQLTQVSPMRFDGVCEGADCRRKVVTMWQRLQEATEAAYDRTAACELTTLHGWEWSANTEVRNLHRNVVFRNARVPELPISYYDAPTPRALWEQLAAACDGLGDECDVLAIPHNSNLSNGGMFAPGYPDASTIDDERAQATLRARVEPLVETFQHKGSSECLPGVAGILGAPDELCAFEEIRSPVADDCGDAIGQGGIVNDGCVSRWDYVRNALLLGLSEEERIGVNPFRFGFIGSTDTHNGTPGATEEADYEGHIGREEDTTAERLGPGFAQPSGFIANPGGLAGVWAVESSRDAVFEALARREAFSTSGTRIAPRLFAGWDLDPDLCDDPRMIEHAYESGVPMGAVLPPGPAGAAPKILAAALRDPSSDAAPLERLQIVKGWTSSDGELHYEVFDVAGGDVAMPGVEASTCRITAREHDSLCTVWTDPDFDPEHPAYYYLRVVETPSCRWSWRQCLTLPENERPASCADPNQRIIHEMAWTSPIWFAVGE